MYRLQDFWHQLLGTVAMKPKGRRCSFKHKVLALSLLKVALNPIHFSIHYLLYFPDESYRPFLTLRFRTAINAHLFDTPICPVQTMSDGDRVCCLMFGEMSITGNLHFNQKCGCIEGFEDLGNQSRASNVAIIPWSSCFVVSVKSGNNHYLTT